MKLFRRKARPEPNQTLLSVPNLDEPTKREAEEEARRDAEADPLPEPPLPYQQRLEVECDHALRADMEQRQHDFAALLASEVRNRQELRLSEERLEPAKERLSAREQTLESLERPRWPGRLDTDRKFALLLFLGLFEYYLVLTALDVLSLDDWVKHVLAALIGIVPILVIELHASHILNVLKWHGERIEKRRSWIFDAVVLSVLGIAIMLFIIAMGVVRGEGFSGGGFEGVPRGYGSILAGTLALLQLIATTGAVAITRQHAMADEWRDLNADVASDRAKVAGLEGRIAALEAEYPQLLARHCTFRETVVQHHIAILDYFADREACYRNIFSRIHPTHKNKLEVWPLWQAAILTAFEPLYQYFEPAPELAILKPATFPTATDGRDGDEPDFSQARATARDAAGPDKPERTAEEERSGPSEGNVST